MAGSKLVIVMGHTECGAVKHAIDNTNAAAMDMNALQSLLDEIKPSLANVSTDGEKSSKNATYTNNVIIKNAKQTVEDIRKRSPIMSELEKKGEIKIISAIYDMASGDVKFL